MGYIGRFTYLSLHKYVLACATAQLRLDDSTSQSSRRLRCIISVAHRSMVVVHGWILREYNIWAIGSTKYGVQTTQNKKYKLHIKTMYPLSELKVRITQRTVYKLYRTWSTNYTEHEVYKYTRKHARALQRGHKSFSISMLIMSM